MEGEAFSENPELTNFDLETDDVSDGSNMSSSCGNSNEYESQNAAEEEIVVVRDMTDIKKLAADNFPIADITKYEIVSLDVAYMFYCWYAKMSGFAVRKGHVIRNRERHVLQQTFLCSREGFRHERGLTAEERQPYRKMSLGDIDEIERNRTAGIRPYQVYGSMANTSGGFHKVGFVKKDLYNQVGKQRKQLYSDSCGAVKYLRDLGTKDSLKVIENPIKNNYSTLTGLKVIENPTKNNYSTLTGLKVLKIPTKNNYSNLTGLKVIENPIKNNYSTLTRLKVIENPTKNNYSTLTGLKVLKIPTKNNYSNLTGLKVIENPIKNNYSTLTRCNSPGEWLLARASVTGHDNTPGRVRPVLPAFTRHQLARASSGS
ncbi:hypothetical protein QL285_068580 [Trifolium repens]|nr:hypothetical protein QL285_068580 [Trifolium repens]